MEMQRTYGTPWEVVFAQMQMESGTGTAGHAINGAHNNWLGITGTGDAGSWTSPGGRNWAVYSSIEASIADWAGPRVLRNGMYNAAFQYLDPNSYSLGSFLQAMIAVYAPSSDGNNVEVYVANVLSFINGPIREVREEMGWPSSAELAEQENIPIGGQNPLGGTVDPTQAAGTCFMGGNGDITEAAIAFSWEGMRSQPKNNPTPAYREAMEAVGLAGVSCNGGPSGASCDVFVATVMRATVDPNFPCCGTSNQLANLAVNPLYEEIPNLGNTSNLQSGDIFVLNGHIMMFIIDNGTPKMAHASCNDRTGERGGVFFSDSRGAYRIFRYIGGA
ncbi:glucosaminidase domain-containing protein [Candidatus Saccharibacteria bacterium]|nr:glucosaminidase domain-containing protein [Candidatus Saccharibacteria bacterium]